MTHYSEVVADNTKPTKTMPSLLTKVLGHFSIDWLTLLPPLFNLLSRWLKRQEHEGMYEILEYDATLELLDRRGKTAIFKRQQHIKFLQDYIIAFQDYAWGEGNIFADYKCSPGVEVDRYREGNQWNILISLRGTKNAGEEMTFYTERKIKEGFINKVEAWQTSIRHRTRQFKLAIIFPKTRRCRRATLLYRHREHPFNQEHFSTLPDGRQMLTWETNSLKHFEDYTIKWWW